MSEENFNQDESGRVPVIRVSKGIGKAIALKFARKGLKLVLNAREKLELSEALNDVRK